jgi:hypothetical protein
MATLNQVVQQIRFGLEQLRSRNAHHEFEHLCRRYARARICSNILPATGPVSAGGDQGRDFESFRTYLQNSPITNSSFIGRVANDPVVFACTIQDEDSLPGKIKNDVGVIVASGTKVLHINYFCAADLPVGRRHAVQTWARDTHSVELEIHDGQAISEVLADNDVFWIATEFLGIPSEIYPKPNEAGHDRYAAAKEKWTDPTPDLHSFAEFDEVKRCLRRAMRTDKLKQDLPFWITRMQRYLQSSRQFLARRARYEIAVARLRGLGTLVGFEDDVRPYLSNIPTADAPVDELEDYGVLLSYCTTATALGHAEFSLPELKQWHHEYRDALERGIRERTNPSTRAQLLQFRGQLAIHNVTDAGVGPSHESPFIWWNELLDLVPAAPLFPLDRFADCLTAMCAYAHRLPGYAELTARVDDALSKREGGFAAAAKCRDRAVALHKSGQTLDAIAEIHKAKVNWFAAETLRGSVLAMLVVGQWYRELGLFFAAKYYALAAAHVALHSGGHAVQQKVPSALFEAALCDYGLGAWAGFLDLTGCALRCHQKLALEPGNIEAHPLLSGILFHLAASAALSSRLSGRHGEFVKARIAEWQLGEFYDEAYELARAQIASLPQAKVIAQVEDQLQGVPVNDVQTGRCIAWKALGVEWSVEWVNTFQTTALAEQVVACLQIIQAELARKDLCLPSVHVTIAFELGAVSEPKLEPVLTNESLQWTLIWPQSNSRDEADAVFSSVLGASFSVIHGVSLLPSNLLMTMIEYLFKSGVPGRVFVGHSYETLYRTMIPEEAFNSGRRILAVPDIPLRQSPVKEPEALARPPTPGPGYSKEASCDQIRRRYERMQAHLPLTLQRLKADASFQAIVAALRKKGWRDWHILHSVFTCALNHYAHSHVGAHACEVDQKRMSEQFMKLPESDRKPEPPVELFTEAAMEEFRMVNLASILKTWDLEIHHPTVSFEAIEQVLTTRYGYWSDDVEHPHIF